jgi:hypothetical protein
VRLGRVYKQINAPFEELAQKTLNISTAALVSNAPGDAFDSPGSFRSNLGSAGNR